MHMIQNSRPLTEYGVSEHISTGSGESPQAFKVAVVTDCCCDQKSGQIDAAVVVDMLRIIIA